MAVTEQPEDVVRMTDFEWRSSLRAVTPFIDGDMARKHFKDYSPGDYLCSEVIGDRPAFGVELHGMNLDGIFDYFAVHCIDWEAYRDAIYAVHTSKKSSLTGRTIEIPTGRTLARRLSGLAHVPTIFSQKSVGQRITRPRRPGGSSDSDRVRP